MELQKILRRLEIPTHYMIAAKVCSSPDRVANPMGDTSQKTEPIENERYAVKKKLYIVISLCFGLFLLGTPSCGTSKGANSASTIAGASGLGSGGQGDGGQGGGASGGTTGGTTLLSGPSWVSRNRGVAPLYVFFDVRDASDVTQPALVNGRREYADVRYDWDFGDATSGNWATSSRPKNRETGYLAAHVYELPGTYTVTLNVTTPSGSLETHTTSIAVSDPEGVYSGSSTTCVSTGKDFTGCPSGAAQATTNTFADFSKYIGTGKRLLLRRGDSWSTSSTIWLATSGPTTVGAFGPCSQPDRFAICANSPTLNSSGTGAVLQTNNTTDLRVMDLKFVGATSLDGAVYGTTEIYQNLYLRLVVEGFSNGIASSQYNTRDFTGIAVVSCEVHQQDSMGLFLGGVQLSLLGNEVKDIASSHVVRLWQAYRSVVAHNELSGSSLQTSLGRHALKLHGPKETTISTLDSAHLANRTQYFIVSNNLFGSSGPWPVAIGPEDEQSDERLQDILFEKNRIYPAFGTPSSQSPPVSVAVSVWGSNMTIRNNLFSAVGADKGFWAVIVDRRGIEPVGSNDRIYNNTVYFSVPNQAGTAAFAIRTVTNAIVQNNLVQMPASAQNPPLLQDDGQGTVADHNLLTTDAGFVDPANSNPLLTDFSLSAQSSGINAGTTVPVYDDFAGNNRPSGGAYDLGAFERP